MWLVFRSTFENKNLDDVLLTPTNTVKQCLGLKNIKGVKAFAHIDEGLTENIVSFSPGTGNKMIIYLEFTSF